MSRLEGDHRRSSALEEFLPGSKREGSGGCARERLQAETAVCRRELAFRRAELNDLEERAQREKQRQQQERAELHGHIEETVQHARATSRKHSEERASAQRLLSLFREELQETHSEMAMSEAERELARMLHRDHEVDRRECEALRKQVGWTQAEQTRLGQESSTLEARVFQVKEEIGASGGMDFCQQRAEEVLQLERALGDRQEEVAEYRAYATNLHADMQQVLQALRVGHDEALAENEELEAHVKSLEGEVERDAATTESACSTPSGTRSASSRSRPPSSGGQAGGSGLAPSHRLRSQHHHASRGHREGVRRRPDPAAAVRSSSMGALSRGREGGDAMMPMHAPQRSGLDYKQAK